MAGNKSKKENDGIVNERYSKVSLFMDIVFAFANTNKYEGLSIQNIMDEFRLSRSTVMRIKAAIDRYFGLEEVNLSKERIEKEKRWYLSSEKLKTIISIRPEEFAQLEACKDIMTTSGRSSAGKTIERLVEKLKIVANKEPNENDIEALLESQGYAIRQAPKTKIPVEILEKISHAILANTKIKFDYKNSKGIVESVCAEPYGIVYGTNVNLLAHKSSDPEALYKYYTLSKMKKLEILNDDYFFPDENFSLKEYLKNSFGIYQQEKKLDVKLKFDKTVAESVLDYSFHPSQKMETLENGDVIVTFNACGDREMCWHFFTWGKNCQILEPQELKDKYKQLLTDALETIN